MDKNGFFSWQSHVVFLPVSRSRCKTRRGITKVAPQAAASSARQRRPEQPINALINPAFVRAPRAAWVPWGRRCLWVRVALQDKQPRPGHRGVSAALLPWLRRGRDRPRPPAVSGALRARRGNLCPCLGQGMVLCPNSDALASGQIPFPVPAHALFISFRSALTQQQPPRQRKPFLLSEGGFDLQEKQKVRAFHHPWMI